MPPNADSGGCYEDGVAAAMEAHLRNAITAHHAAYQDMERAFAALTSCRDRLLNTQLDLIRLRHLLPPNGRSGADGE